ncbi:MAG: xanthan lyase [Alistipes sp.]|nr:xanthan lyase [Alistipes sp.]
MLSRIVRREVLGGYVEVESVRERGKTLEIKASVGLSYYPFREDNLRAVYDSVRSKLPSDYAGCRLEIYSGKHLVDNLVPLMYRRRSDQRRFTNRALRPLVERIGTFNNPESGLAGRHIAMWQSHGRYFDQRENQWRWQRSRLWETVEDLYTQGYVLPYLVPMLENAGATVLLPRERDLSKVEIIADNDHGVDAGTRYREYGRERWEDAGVGFAHLREEYLTGQNPFTEGSARSVSTTTHEQPTAAAVWGATIPERGRYGIYVSYKTLDDSAEDARYTVCHLGGRSQFSVNQRMGGGMWVYLGEFDLPAGYCDTVVMLDNRSSRRGARITADAVKIGGGMGNVARTVSVENRMPGIDYVAETSGYPRFCEGARYWLQWSGFPEDVYTPKDNRDDYRDDYMSRAHWVNALMGGSERLPDKSGKSIPVDLAFAFHSDAGVRLNDDIIGTLGIYCTQDNGGSFEGGASRMRSRDLTDAVMSQIVGDVRALYEPDWSRRGMWDRAYYEARVPNVPTMLLELLSHQNFADMRYGLDPRFRFTVCRAIYKAMLRYLAFQYSVPYVVQPLPVAGFRAELVGECEVELSWRAVEDRLEPTAVPTYYVVYTRIDDGAFDGGRRVESSCVRFEQRPDHIYSYRVTAVNDGGESFPSETLAAGRVSGERGRVMIVNGFDRVSAPMSVQGDSIAGFYNLYDDGVPYVRDISFIGDQHNFSRALSKSDNDNYALGSCYNDYETEIIAGNTFDYVAVHGRSIVQAGYSFCSSSRDSFETTAADAARYDAVDLILGKQRSVTMGRGTSGYAFKTFSRELQQALRRYVDGGGALLVSGAYVATDMWHSAEATEADRDFARGVLHYSFGGNMATRRGSVRTVPSRFADRRYDIRFATERNDSIYRVESPDVLQPAGKGAFTSLRYTSNNQSAGVAFVGKYRTFVVGFPFETIVDAEIRDKFMAQALRFLTEK